VYAKVNRLGFIETPYREVKNGKVNLGSEPIYLSAEEEDNKYIAQANAQITKDGVFENDNVIS
jgi:DNA-directed RNA polymerase subunit beta